MSLLFTQSGMRYQLWTQSSGLSGHRDLWKISLYSFSPQDPRKAATSENYKNDIQRLSYNQTR